MKKYLITFEENVDEKLLLNYGAKNIELFKYSPKICVCDLPTNLNIDNLIDEESVHSVELDGEDEDMEFIDEDTPDNQGESYAIQLHEVKKFHEKGITGKGVKVAIFDGGIARHQDLKIAGGFSAMELDGNYTDYTGHGTHVAGIIGMQDNDIGYLGVAPDVELYAVKLKRHSGGGNPRSAQIRAMEWAIDNNIDIVNCSYSGTTDSEARREIFRKAAEEHGIIIVTSAGNRQRDEPIDKDTMGYPSRYPFVYAVANVDRNGKRYVSSSCGSQVKLSGAGVNIMSTCIDENNPNGISSKYCSKTGTSMASPTVAGVVALYKQMHPDLDREELMELVMGDADKVGDTWQYGAGIPRYPIPQKNIIMHENVDGLWERLYPFTKASNVLTTFGENVEQMLYLLGGELNKNENGHYMKFNNGLLICWGETSDLLDCTQPRGDGTIYRSSESARWYFPVPFLEADGYYVGASVSGSSRWAIRSSSGNRTNVQFRHLSYSPLTTKVPTSVFAVGRWK